MLYIYDERLGNVGLVKATPEKFDLLRKGRDRVKVVKRGWGEGRPHALFRL
jgi:hypothetical protein